MTWPLLPEPVLEWHVCDGSGDDLPPFDRTKESGLYLYQLESGAIRLGWYRDADAGKCFDSCFQLEKPGIAFTDFPHCWEGCPRVVRWCYQLGSEG